jgi:hypothetical protein
VFEQSDRANRGRKIPAVGFIIKFIAAGHRDGHIAAMVAAAQLIAPTTPPMISGFRFRAHVVGGASGKQNQ